ncbi:MAG: signal peptidase I [Lachnospiraceae bacterium]|nr:signal peptidase I [Lachnospiraceae bacterium]
MSDEKNTIDENKEVLDETVEAKEQTEEENVPDNNLDSASEADADNTENAEEIPKWEPIHKKSKWLMTKGDIFYYSFMVLLMLAIIITSRFLIGLYSVDGDSMRNTLTDGDVGICQKFNIKNTLNRGDIVIFWSDELDEYLIKRCVAVAGDTVEMNDGVLLVNGKLVEENYIREPMEEEEGFIPYTELSGDEFFAMGDNRNESCDCRDLGPAKYNKISGIVIYNMGQSKLNKRTIIIIIVVIFAVLLLLSYIEDIILRSRLNKLPEEIREFDVDYEENEDGSFTVGIRDDKTGALHLPETVKNAKEARAYAKQYGKGFYYYLPKK